MLEKDKKTSVLSFFFVFSLVYLVGGRHVQYQTSCVSKVPLGKYSVPKALSFQTRPQREKRHDVTSTHERRLGSVFCSAGDEPRNTMYILEQVFKKFITSPFGHDYTFYFII